MSQPKKKPVLCGLCQKRATARNPLTRDHVFPQGLGVFTNAFIARLCLKCNTKVGKKLEDAVFHSSYVAIIRALLQIRSKNSIKNKIPYRNPLPPESERKAVDPLADVTVEWKGKTLQARAVTENGHVDLPDVLFIERKDEEPIVLSVADKDIDQIVSMATNAIAGKRANIELYHKDPAIIKEWQKRMVESGLLVGTMSIEPPSALLKGHVHGTMEEIHLQTHGYILAPQGDAVCRHRSEVVGQSGELRAFGACTTRSYAGRPSRDSAARTRSRHSSSIYSATTSNGSSSPIIFRVLSPFLQPIRTRQSPISR